MPNIVEIYLRDYDKFKIKGKGLTIFNSSENSFNELNNNLQRNNVNVLSIRTSENFSDKLEMASTAEHISLFQDLDQSNLALKAESIVNKFIFIAFCREIPFCLFSPFDQSMYSDISIQSDRIHYDIQEVLNLLYIEQIYMLLEQVNLTFANENALIDMPENTLYTPIEKLLRDEMFSRNLQFIPQAKFGRHIVDFLVECNQRKLLIECDGRDFHNPQKDKERESILKQYNIPLIRFSGSELFSNVTSCVDKVEQFIYSIHAKPHYSIDPDLDPSQLKPIDQIDGPIRLLAPAGSGKTKTLVNRVLSLLNNGIRPNQILVLAFNKKAASQMVDKLEAKEVQTTRKLSDDGVSVRTFHSFGYEIIQNQLKWRINQNDIKKQEKRILGKASEELLKSLPNYKKKDAIETLLNALRRVKMELCPLNSFKIEFDNKIYPFEQIFNNYLDFQSQYNFLSFDDMIYMANRLLLKDRILRQNLQRRFDYILVDEFQDLNEAQLLLLQTLSLPNYNLFIVGDDDQMIYGWRGARVEHIINFKKRYAQSKEYVLDTNYRSAKCIVRHSGFLIDHNYNRVKKNIKPFSRNLDGKIEVKLFDSVFQQAQEAVQWIIKNKEEYSLKWSDFAVLFRYHDYIFPIAMILDGFQIPHTPINSTRLFQSFPGMDIYSYLTVILHPQDASTDDFARILRRPNKYIPNDIISKASDWDTFQSLYAEEELPIWLAKNLEDFLIKLKSIQGVTNDYSKAPGKLVNAIYCEFNFYQFYNDKSNLNKDIDAADDCSKMEVISSVANTFTNLNDFYAHVYKTIHEEEDPQDNEQEDFQNKVYLSSIHSSKGKEFPNVVLFNLSPGFYGSSEIEIEEERRVCYVGFTRAKNNILITAPKESFSNFLIELLLNPKLKSNSVLQLHSELSQALVLLQIIKSKIDRINFKINQLIIKYPELDGKEGPEQSTPFLKKQISKIDQSKIRYMELTEMEDAHSTVFFHNLSRMLHKLKVHLIKTRLERLEDKVIELKMSLFENRKSQIDSAGKELMKHMNSKLKVEINELIPLTETINEYVNELEYRQIINKKCDNNKEIYPV